MEKKYVTEISLEDFKKLNLVGYKRVWKDLENYRILVWEKHNINDIIDKEMNSWEKGVLEPNTCVIAIHSGYDEYKDDNKKIGENFYYDKWLNRSGARTYQIGFGISKMYNSKSKWYCCEDYFDIKKDETERIYFIHL